MNLYVSPVNFQDSANMLYGTFVTLGNGCRGSRQLRAQLRLQTKCSVFPNKNVIHHLNSAHFLLNKQKLNYLKYVGCLL